MVLVSEQDAGLYFVQITSRDISGVSLEAKMILNNHVGYERSRHQRLVTAEDYHELGVRLYYDTRPVEDVKNDHRLQLIRESARIVSRTNP